MMKVLKIIGYLFLLVIVIIAALVSYVKTALPDVGEPPALKVEMTEEQIERGRYLANSVCVCMDCHSTRDFSKFSGPLTEGTLGRGGDRFDQSIGIPGVFYAKNITPASIQEYTDGELFRVITTGVNKHGRAMFPLMPFLYYGKMDKEDIYSIIAYLRTIEPIQNDVPESVPDFPMNLIINTIPKKGDPQERPKPSDQLAYGAYLVNASGCIECHTQVEKGQIMKELAFSGGREFKFPDGSVVRSSNITADHETGIGKWTKEQFLARFKTFGDSAYVAPSVKPGEFNTIMPWTMYGKMTEEDLTSIFTYIQTVSPIKNKVVIFSAAPGQ
ncbi:MAG: cytochrome C [Marivirga sp.]|nr:cytochrome C [Marivirga sp.]